MWFSSFLEVCKLLVFMSWMFMSVCDPCCGSGFFFCVGVRIAFSACVSGVKLCKLCNWLSTCSRLAFVAGFRSN